MQLRPSTRARPQLQRAGHEACNPRRKQRLRGIYPAPFDKTWNALVDVFNAENWPIDQIDKDSGFVSTSWGDIAAHPGWADCGKAALATDIRREGSFRVFVREEPSGTRVDVTSAFQVLREVLGGSRGYSSCTSTGILEQRIHVLLLSNLR